MIDFSDGFFEGVIIPEGVVYKEAEYYPVPAAKKASLFITDPGEVVDYDDEGPLISEIFQNNRNLIDEVYNFMEISKGKYTFDDHLVSKQINDDGKVIPFSRRIFINDKGHKIYNLSNSDHLDILFDSTTREYKIPVYKEDMTNQDVNYELEKIRKRLHKKLTKLYDLNTEKQNDDFSELREMERMSNRSIG